MGERVGIPWLHTACGHCEYCYSGWETLCYLQKNTGYSVNGCYAEYILADPNYVARLPENLDYTAAASILCAGLTVYKGIKETDIKAGEWLVISGIGGLGHMAIQYAKVMGLNVIAIDIHKPQLELARSLHADIVIDASIEDPVIKVQKEVRGAHGVLATAVAADTFTQAVNMLRPHGTVSLVGLPPGDFKISIFDMVLSRKTVRGSIVGTRKDLAECLAFAAQGKVVAHCTFTKLENINDILKKMESGNITGRVVMQL